MIYIEADVFYIVGDVFCIAIDVNYIAGYVFCIAGLRESMPVLLNYRLLDLNKINLKKKASRLPGPGGF